MSLAAHVRAMARNNAASNHRLLTACCALDPAAVAARRTSFFPSIRATLNHILTVDWYYLDALTAGGRGLSCFEPEEPFAEVAALAAAQRASDRDLVAFCDSLTDAALERPVRLDRGRRGIELETVGTVLPHLFVHQIHHRGQVHAMLAGTEVRPPQLDEFFLSADAGLRAADLAALGLDA
ncbi:DinB family protein [Oleisolibacter albus]|uniref:DinB family protein n=1 Tax=Oleisolibacter albus TaxID=2171757 RepID=UPI000DF384E7|nr:DinB family protein [Oleisolibacter albus]